MAIRAAAAAIGWMIALAGGCGTPETITIVPTVHGTEDERSIRTGAGTRIALDANPSTGFGWSLDTAASSGLDHVKVTDEGFIRSDSGLIGGPGRRWWLITGRQPGRATLHFIYRRAWEPDSTPARSRTVVIDVR